MSAALAPVAPQRPLPIFDLGDGRKFVPSGHKPITETPFDGWTEDVKRSWVATLWRDSYDAKRPETARLQRNSAYYDGWHYEEGWLNRVNPIENEVYRVVEVQVANTIAVRPRPEIRPMQGCNPEWVDTLQRYATSICENSGFDRAVLLGARDKRIFGWNWWMVSFDFATGMPYALPGSVFDLYTDPGGRNEYECGYFIIAQAVPTYRLRATFPGQASRIRSDGIASPSYQAVVRPYYEFLNEGSFIAHPEIADSSMVVHDEGTTPTEGTMLVGAPAERMEHGSTTFILQVLVRDDAAVDCEYYGTMQYENGEQAPAMTWTGKAPRSASGWWLVTMTSDGVFLGDPTDPADPMSDVAPKQVDECYDGLPIVFDRVAQRTDIFWSRADIDHAIPIQRDINRTNLLFQRGLELAANPPILADRMSGFRAALNGGTVAGGEVVDIARGSEVKFLPYPGIDGRFFERLSERRKVIQDIVGTPESLEGSRPAGIEAASAIRQLDQNSQRRLQGGENPAHAARSELVRKLMYCAGRKLQPEILFQTTAGDSMTVTSEMLTARYHVQFAQGTGTVEGRKDRQDQALALFDREIIDEQAVLDVFDWPGGTEIAARMVERKMQEKAMAAAMQAQAGPSGGGGGGKGSTQDAAA